MAGEALSTQGLQKSFGSLHVARDISISLPRGSGQIVINGAAARHFHPGDKVIIVAFCLTDEAVEPRMIAVDEQNRFVRDLVPNGSPEDIPEPATR